MGCNILNSMKLKEASFYVLRFKFFFFKEAILKRSRVLNTDCSDLSITFSLSLRNVCVSNSEIRALESLRLLNSYFGKPYTYLHIFALKIIKRVISNQIIVKIKSFFLKN